MISTSSPTEERNPRTIDIDTWSSLRIIKAILDEDRLAVAAANSAAPVLAAAVERAVELVSAGGVVHYFGAGASGRQAVADATEATPTFGAPDGLFNAHYPGGAEAIMDPRRDFEDAESFGRRDAAEVRALDMVVGIAASGSTPYVQGALAVARERGATTALITSNPRAEIGQIVDFLIVAPTGAEVITGSTRMKAGTAAKVILTAFSTALMVRSGRTYSNLMVALHATNIKLERRAIEVLSMATSLPEPDCERALMAAEGEIPVALVQLLAGVTHARARLALENAGSVRAALDTLARGADD